MSAKALVLSYWNLNNPMFGGGRRVEALLATLGKSVLLCQPGAPHPTYESVTYRVDFGRRKRGINWGIFNFFWGENAALARQLARERAPAVVVHTSIWTYFPFRRTRGVPMVLDAHDVLAVAIAERYGEGHPFTRTVRAWERRVVRSMDHVFACSARDRDTFRTMYGLPEDKVSAVPNGVDLREFDSPADLASADPAVHGKLAGAVVLYFVGKLDYQPNRQGLQFLNAALMSELDRRCPGRFKLLVCGGPVPVAPYHKSIVFAGRVPSTLPYLRRADICLAPVFTGSGTRLKVLEYLAAGKPVVSTAKGAEGLDYTSGRDLIVADEKEFADRIIDLADHPEKARSLGAAGRSLVEKNYDWSACIQPKWKQVFRQWIDV